MNNFHAETFARPRWLKGMLGFSIPSIGFSAEQVVAFSILSLLAAAKGGVCPHLAHRFVPTPGPRTTDPFPAPASGPGLRLPAPGFRIRRRPPDRATSYEFSKGG